MPLVYQQGGVIRANCGIKVVELSGEKIAGKKFSTDLWEEAYESTDVVVLTAQILLDLFRHGFIEMGRVWSTIVIYWKYLEQDLPTHLLKLTLFSIDPSADL